MPFKIHRRVEHPNNLEDVLTNPEKNDVFSLGGHLAPGKEVMPETVERRTQQKLSETAPESIQVNILLPFTPFLQSILSDRTEILNRRLGEFEPHFLERSSSLNAFFVATRRTAPASSWA